MGPRRPGGRLPGARAHIAGAPAGYARLRRSSYSGSKWRNVNREGRDEPDWAGTPGLREMVHMANSLCSETNAGGIQIRGKVALSLDILQI